MHHYSKVPFNYTPTQMNSSLYSLHFPHFLSSSYESGLILCETIIMQSHYSCLFYVVKQNDDDDDEMFSWWWVKVIVDITHTIFS